MRNNCFIGFGLALFLVSCQFGSQEIKTSSNDMQLDNVSKDEGKSFLVGDTIKISVPSNWYEVKSDQFTLREECDSVFCGNMVCYLMPNVDQFTRLRLGELFVQNLSVNYRDFKLIHSQITEPDSSGMSFDYLLIDDQIKLGGTTFIHIKGTDAVVYSFMGYNGENGEYVTFREKVTRVMNTLEYL